MLGAWWPSALAGGITTLLWLFGAGKELWYSERFVQVLDRLSRREMFSLLKFENNPPLWFVIARMRRSIAGTFFNGTFVQEWFHDSWWNVSLTPDIRYAPKGTLTLYERSMP